MTLNIYSGEVTDHDDIPTPDEPDWSGEDGVVHVAVAEVIPHTVTSTEYLPDTPQRADSGSAVPGTDREPGTVAVPGSAPPVPEPRNRYADVAALLDGTLPEPPAPAVLDRSDGTSLFYAGQVNWLFGDPECGKTWVCAAGAVEQLQRGHSVLWVDLDHNGPAAVVSRLLSLGAPISALRDPARFRFTEPEERGTLLLVVADALACAPALIVVDSIGELLPLFGVSSNSPDDFTIVHAHVLKPFARSGAAVVAVDHLAKNTDSRSSGPGGTAAKRRTIGGTSIRVTVKDAFTPGSGGAAHLAVNKDRHGGLRAHCPTGDREPFAGTFVLTQVGDELGWSITTPETDSRNPVEAAPAKDVAAVAALDPPATTVEDARIRLGWNKQRAGRALKAWRETTVPGSGTQGAEPGTALNLPDVALAGEDRKVVDPPAPPGQCTVCGAVLADPTARRTGRCSSLDAAHRLARGTAGTAGAA